MLLTHWARQLACCSGSHVSLHVFPHPSRLVIPYYGGRKLKQQANLVVDQKVKVFLIGYVVTIFGGARTVQYILADI